MTRSDGRTVLSLATPFMKSALLTLSVFLMCGCLGMASDVGDGAASGSAADAGASADSGAFNGGPVDSGGSFDAGRSLDGLDAGQGVDAGSAADAGVRDAGPRMVPIFVATGHMARSIISCDDGRSWVANQSDADLLRCFYADGNPDGGDTNCDHNEGANHGLIQANGWFIASYGHGMPGSVRRSRDGVTWERAIEGTQFAGLTEGNGVILAAGRQPMWSRDNGSTWQGTADVALSMNGNVIYNVRAATYGKGIFTMFAADGANHDFVVTTDTGASWQHATLPPECGANTAGTVGFGYANGRFIYVDSANICVSSDGLTYTSAPLPAPASIGPVWTGTEFLLWGQYGDPTYQRVLMRSPDAVTWSITAPLFSRYLSADGGVEMGGPPELGVLGRSPTGSLVAIRGGWTNWYDKQQFYRSTDGVTWDVLPSSNYVGSHPMGAILWGLAVPSAACP